MTFREVMSLPIENLIESRLAETGLRRSEQSSRLGYKNISRGLRRLARLSAGDLDGYSGLIAKRPSALRRFRRLKRSRFWNPRGSWKGPLGRRNGADDAEDERQE